MNEPIKDNISSSEETTPTTNIEKEKKLSDVVQIQLEEKGSKLQKGVLLATLGTLIAYIIISTYQIHQTNLALAKADSSIVNAQKNLEFAIKNADSSDSNNKQSIAIAESSLILVKRNNEASNTISKLGIRPYLMVQKVKLFQFIIGKKIEFEIHLSNTGNTPAQNIHSVYLMKIGGTGVYESEFKKLYNESGFGSYVVSSTENGIVINQVCKFERILKEEVSVNILNGNLKFFIYGFITYTDLFKDSHTTYMCYEFIPSREIFVQYEQFNKFN